MKLGFLIYSYFPYGGQQRDFHRIVSECIERGHEVDIYTLSWQGERPRGAQVTLVPAKGFSRLQTYRRFTRWTSENIARNPVDLVIGFNKMPGLDIYFAADPCFAQKADLQRGAYYKFTPRYHHFKKYEQAVFGPSSNTAVWILSPLQYQAFESYYPGCGKRLFQVPPGIDEDRKHSADSSTIRQSLRNELSLDSESLLILQVGSGFKIKGVDRSLTAVASLPDELKKRVTYILIGQDKPAKYLSMARKLGLEKQFRVLPGRDDIPRFLFGADLLIHPAYSESAGYVLLEATIAGLPVLTTATCGYSLHIKQAGSGLVCDEPFDQEDLNTKLQYMLLAPERSDWITNGLEYGNNDELYSLATAAADFIDRFQIN